MSERIFTLFGEEILPEPAKTTPKGRNVAIKPDKADTQNAAAPLPDATASGVSLFGEAISNDKPTIAESTPAVDEPVAIEPLSATTEVATEKEIAIPESIPEKEVQIAEALLETIEMPIRKTKATATKKETPSVETTTAELPENWKGDKQYYTIGEVAALFKVNTSHIRFWTNEFKIKVRTTRKGDRLYTQQQINELRNIYHLVKDKGYKLSGAKAKMKEQKKVDVTAFNLKEALLQLRNDLLQIRNQL